MDNISYICILIVFLPFKDISKTLIMKNSFRLAAFGLLLLAMFTISEGCKKKTEDPVPTFTMSYDTVSLTSGGKGVQFYAQCTNNDVTMTTVTIINPDSGLYIHNANNASYGKNTTIPLQATNTAYIMNAGTWKFNLAGNTGGGTAFSVNETVAVSK